MTRHPIHDLDDDVHQRVRLGILATLQNTARADFGHLKTSLGLTDGNLGRHLQALEEAGLVTQRRTTGDGRPRTWVKITARGRRAQRNEIAALERLLGTLQQPQDAALDAEIQANESATQH
jgi:DNA-binding MarR family transcriptional regulator